jgi:Asp-tRNA(Asn)/Glu-tRNA(Gln) amidotransferase C subunit
MEMTDGKTRREALKALAALAGEEITEAELERMGPDLARVSASVEALRKIDVSGLEPAFVAPLPRD